MQLAMRVPSSLLRWRVQQRELFAISDDSELGLMQSMLTVSMNDGCPELAACVRRGPFAVADENEMVQIGTFWGQFIVRQKTVASKATATPKTVATPKNDTCSRLSYCDELLPKTTQGGIPLEQETHQ